MRWIRRLTATIRPLFRRGRVEQELAAELQFHLEQEAREHLALGMSSADARSAAVRSFGSVAQVKEECRASLGLRLIDECSQDIRHTVRGLIKDPAFTLIAIVTLALGIGANTSLFTLLDAVVFKPLRVPGSGELVMLYENGPEGTADPAGGTGRYLRFSYPRFERLQRALGAYGSLAAVTRSAGFIVRRPGAAEPQLCRVQLVSGGYFSTLRVTPARGRLLHDDDVRLDQTSAVAVISDGFWKRMFGGIDSVIGEPLVVNGVTVTIVGVTQPDFIGVWTDSEADVWLPLTLQQMVRYSSNSSTYGSFDNNRPWLEQDLVAWLNLIGRIPAANRPHAIPLLATANQDGLRELAAASANTGGGSSMLAHTLVVESASHGFSGVRARFADALFALTALVGLVLMVTCANIANLLLARATGHARDMGVRISLGASTGRLIRQGFTESLFLALLGGACGVVLGNRASSILAHQVLGTSRLPQVFAPDARVLSFAAGTCLLTAIGFGLAPAARAIRLGRTAAMATNQRQTVGLRTMRGMRFVVVGQLALSVVVVFAAILFARTFINFTRIEPGFSADRLVTASFDPVISGYAADQLPAVGRRLVAAAGGVPGVMSAAVARCGILAGCSSTSGFRIEAGEYAGTVTLHENWISAGYFATVGIPLVAGREFTDRDREGSLRVAVVNESTARRYFRGQAIGRRLGYSRLDTEVVGVVRDAYTHSLHEPPVPMVYFPVEQKQGPVFTAAGDLEVRVAGDPAGVVASIRQAVRRTEPDLMLFDVSLLSSRLARDLGRERLVTSVAASFGALTLLVASLGLYGVLSYGVVRRTQEIGVRMALGARRVEVMGLVLAQSAKLIAVGMGLGAAGAAGSARYVSGMLFGVSWLDPWTISVVMATFVVVTACASYIPAHRAASVDPLVALRCE